MMIIGFPIAIPIIAFLAFIIGAISISNNAFARASHIALVIGNSAYVSAPELENPVNDAEDIATALEKIGYEVSVNLNVDYDKIRRALADFSIKSSEAEVAIVYFAGHGIEIDNKNFLIPIDATLENESQIAFQAIPLEMITDSIASANKLKIVLLDACRDNPFAKKMTSTSKRTRSTVSRGLAAVEPQAGTLVAFAAKEGTTASDGEGRNSPFTKAVLQYISIPSLDIGLMFRKIRDTVLADTGHQQEPFVYGSLPGVDIFLASGPSDTGEKTENPSGGIAKEELSEAREAWEAIKDSNEAADYVTFIKFYGESIYAKFATARLESLNKNLNSDLIESQKSDSEQFNGISRWYLATYNNLDLFGADFSKGGFSVSSPDECANLCGQNLACKAFTFNAEARRCFLKSGYIFAQTFSGATSGFFFQADEASESPAFRSEWDIYNKSDLVGTDIGDSKAQTFEACRASCDAIGGCVGFSFVYYTKQNQCWLKSGAISGPVKNSRALKGVTSGVRANRAISAVSVRPVISRD